MTAGNGVWTDCLKIRGFVWRFAGSNATAYNDDCRFLKVNFDQEVLHCGSPLLQC